MFSFHLDLDQIVCQWKREHWAVEYQHEKESVKYVRNDAANWNLTEKL